MEHYDIAFVGNGSIASISAAKVKQKFPKLRVAIIGPHSMLYSASAAAGAMHAVFCEAEEKIAFDPNDILQFEIGLESRSIWRSFLREFRLTNLITAENTIMYKRLNSTPFEDSNFVAACKLAEEHGVLCNVTSQEVEVLFQGGFSGDKIVAKKFIGEFAFDALNFLKQLKKINAELNVSNYEGSVSHIKRNKASYHISCVSGETIKADRVIIAAGSNSSKLVKPMADIVPVFAGVGTAIHVNGSPNGYDTLRHVVRTPNRGGAQCGLHVVPKTDGCSYVGAGNYLSASLPAHRAETIRYLIETCERELFGKAFMYQATVDLVLGARPRTADGQPVFGPLTADPKVFIASGNYRVGFTQAPLLADEILKWIEKGEISQRLAHWSPVRKLMPYISQEAADNYYSSSRISNLVEHGLLDLNDTREVSAKTNELKKIARAFNEEIIEKHQLDKSFVVDPDMYTILTGAEKISKVLID